MLSKLRNTRLGFTLVELAIVLAVAGLLFGGLWRLLSGGNQQLRDQGAASSQIVLINSVKAFLSSAAGQSFLVQNEDPHCTVPGPISGAPALIGSQKYCGPNTHFNLFLPVPGTATSAGAAGCPAAYPTDGAGNTASGICGYLPGGFNSLTSNSYNQTYVVQVMRDGTAAGSVPSTYSFIVMSINGDPIPDSSGGRIAASIGGDGGFIYQSTTAICGTSSFFACGAYGAWAVDPATYGFTEGAGLQDQGGTPKGGQVATRTYVSPGQTTTFPWLARTVITGDTAAFSFNTMVTSMYMGPTTPGPVATINMQGGNFSMNSTVAPTPVPSAAGGGHFFMSGASLDMASAVGGAPGINMNGEPINMAGGSIGNFLGGAINLTGGTLNLGPSGTAGAISGYANTLGTVFQGATGSSTNPILSIKDSTAYCTDPLFVACQASFQVSGSQSVSGILNAYNLYAQGFLYQSDRRLKKNIVDLSPEQSLDNVMRLKPVSFTFKSSNVDSLGIIAQDLEQIYPQLVVTPQNGTGMKSVNYMGMVAPLIGSVQELKKENDELKQKLSDEQTRLDKLEAMQKSSIGK